MQHPGMNWELLRYKKEVALRYPGGILLGRLAACQIQSKDNEKLHPIQDILKNY